MKITELQVKPSLSKSLFREHVLLDLDGGKSKEVWMRISLEWLMDELRISKSDDPKVKAWFAEQAKSLDRGLISEGQIFLIWKNRSWKKVKKSK